MSKHAPIYGAVRVLNDLVKTAGYTEQHVEALSTVRAYLHKHEKYDLCVLKAEKKIQTLELRTKKKLEGILASFKKNLKTCLEKDRWEGVLRNEKDSSN